MPVLELEFGSWAMLAFRSVARAARPALRRPLSLKATRVALGGGDSAPGIQSTPPAKDWTPGFYVVEDEPPEVLETAADGVTPLVVAPRIELTLEWLIESPPPEHTWEEPPIFYDVVDEK